MFSKILRWKKARQVKINSSRVDLIPRGVLFAAMEHMIGKQKFHTFCYTNECYCNLVYYHQRNINERPVLDTEVSILESEIR